MHRAEILAAATAALVSGIVGTAGADVIYVDADAAGVGSGSSWADAATDLALALGNADPGDELWIAEGTYTPTAIGSPFGVPRGVALYAGLTAPRPRATSGTPWPT